MLNIHFFKQDEDYEGYSLIEGFPGYGLVGTIAANFLIEKLEMDLVGYVDSAVFPPIAVVHKGKPLPAMRIYASKEHKLLIVMSEFVMSLKAIPLAADLIYDWAGSAGVARIISLGGISIKGQQDEVFGITSSVKELKQLKKIGVVPIEEGATSGVNALLLLKASMGGGVPVVSLLAEAKANYVDPLGAAMVLTSLSDYMGIKIDTAELVKEAIVIESKIKQSISMAKKSEKMYSEGETSYGSMYA